jgi:DnaJ-class molecular chaperone
MGNAGDGQEEQPQEVSKEMQCARCKGSGTVTRTTKSGRVTKYTCTVCGGQGKVTRPRPRP